MNDLGIVNKLRVIVAGIALLAIMSQTAVADVVLRGIQVAVPDGYERSERLEVRNKTAVFVRKGDGRAALALLLPQTQFDPDFLKRWFLDNTIASLSITVLDRPKEWESMSADEAQREITRQLAAQWGDYSFSRQSSDPDIRWFVNYAGAFVAVSTRVLSDKIVVVESMNRVHVLVNEKTIPPGRDESAEKLWQFYRSAASAEDAESVLRSARPAAVMSNP